MKVKVQISRYLSAIALPDGRIYRHSKTTSPGGRIIEHWGVVAPGHEENCGWGNASFVGVIDPQTGVEIDPRDLAEIVRQADSGETPAEGSTAETYLNHVPYWGGINDDGRVIERDGLRPAMFDRAEAFYKRCA